MDTSLADKAKELHEITGKIAEEQAKIPDAIAALSTLHSDLQKALQEYGALINRPETGNQTPVTPGIASNLADIPTTNLPIVNTQTRG